MPCLSAGVDQGPQHYSPDHASVDVAGDGDVVGGAVQRQGWSSCVKSRLVATHAHAHTILLCFHVFERSSDPNKTGRLMVIVDPMLIHMVPLCMLLVAAYIASCPAQF